MVTEYEGGLTSLEALGIAIRADMDAAELYSELADRCEDRQIRRRFDNLAADERQQQDQLTQQWEELAKGTALKLPASRLPARKTTRALRRRMSIEDVLDLAIETEREAREFFLLAARETGDLSGRAMFRYLADTAYQHWMVLAQEKDMLIRYPNYGRPGAIPWRPEGGAS
jgi:rubrerythrin